MATLDNTDYTWIKDWVKAHPTINNDFKAWGLNKADWHGALQHIEDWQVAALTVVPTTTLKAEIEVHTGATTVQRAGNVLAAWAAWKAENYTGG